MKTIFLHKGLICTMVACSLATACSDDNAAPEAANPGPEPLVQSAAAEKLSCTDHQPLKRALFGDLHVHTSISFDASAYGVQTMPEDAYRFAKGEEIAFLPLDETGAMAGRVKIDRPLDFMAVTDHAEFMGEFQMCKNEGSEQYDSEYCNKYRAGGFEAIIMTAVALAVEPPQRISPICPQGDEHCIEASSLLWQRTIAAAEQAHDGSADCSFTTFIGYEHTGAPDTSNYHRNVIFRNANVPEVPISYFEASQDYQLWKQLNDTCKLEDGCDYLTIPHNSNLSNGKLLAPYADLEENLDNKLDYARERLAREPLMEIFQHKGNSECANGFPEVFGAPDELCNMEQIREIGAPGATGSIYFRDGKLGYTGPEPNPTIYCKEGEVGSGGMQGNGCLSENDFYRTALLTGLKEQIATGLNPVKLGASANTDSHMSTGGAVQEDNWHGHIHTEWNKDSRLQPAGMIPGRRIGNPGGLTGVWAEENSRESIYKALLRREAFGTSGPRIRPRFFAGWDYPAKVCENPDWVAIGYQHGVPMGADLATPENSSAKPVFIAAASADDGENATPLQKLQIIKGWVDSEGGKHYKVIDMAGEAESEAGVDLATGKRFGDGHESLCAIYRDDDFDPAQFSYYYMRVVENPSPRWSLSDCLSYTDEERPAACADPKVSTAIQEQAWTSPIWYTPQP